MKNEGDLTCNQVLAHGEHFLPKNVDARKDPHVRIAQSRQARLLASLGGNDQVKVRLAADDTCAHDVAQYDAGPLQLTYHLKLGYAEISAENALETLTYNVGMIVPVLHISSGHIYGLAYITSAIRKVEYVYAASSGGRTKSAMEALPSTKKGLGKPMPTSNLSIFMLCFGKSCFY